MAQCSNCGASIRPDANRCMKCGSVLDVAPPPQPAPPPQNQQPYAPQPQQYAPPPPQYIVPGTYVIAAPPKSKIAAALLAFFLGAFGIHNFYLGYKGRGIAQLLLTLFTCGYGAIFTYVWAFIEFILILVGSLNDAWGRPLQG